MDFSKINDFEQSQNVYENFYRLTFYIITEWLNIHKLAWGKSLFLCFSLKTCHSTMKAKMLGYTLKCNKHFCNNTHEEVKISKVFVLRLFNIINFGKILCVPPWFVLQKYNTIGYYRVISNSMLFHTNLMEQCEV